MEEFGQRRLGFVDPMQWRYEVMRSLVLFGDRTATQRAHETQTHPDTVRALTRHFQRRNTSGRVVRWRRKGNSRCGPLTRSRIVRKRACRS